MSPTRDDHLVRVDRITGGQVADHGIPGLPGSLLLRRPVLQGKKGRSRWPRPCLHYFFAPPTSCTSSSQPPPIPPTHSSRGAAWWGVGTGDNRKACP